MNRQDDGAAVYTANLERTVVERTMVSRSRRQSKLQTTHNIIGDLLTDPLLESGSA